MYITPYGPSVVQFGESFLGMGKKAKARRKEKQVFKKEKRAIKLDKKRAKVENKKAKAESTKADSQVKVAQASLVTNLAAPDPTEAANLTSQNGSSSKPGVLSTKDKLPLYLIGGFVFLLILFGFFMLTRSNKVSTN